MVASWIIEKFWNFHGLYWTWTEWPENHGCHNRALDEIFNICFKVSVYLFILKNALHTPSVDCGTTVEGLQRENMLISIVSINPKMYTDVTTKITPQQICRLIFALYYMSFLCSRLYTFIYTGSNTTNYFQIMCWVPHYVDYVNMTEMQEHFLIFSARALAISEWP